MWTNYLVAAVVGCVGGAFFSKMILSSIFATHVNIGILILIISTLGMLLMAALTLGVKIFGVMRVSPSDILRAE